ncbi:MAG: uL15m family ribosomal protein [Candidatus Woesearchaeota archaeon]
MVTNHRKKNSRHRGSWTSGHGEKKKRRGAGHRGGRGNAGSGKRGDAKKPRFWKVKRMFGKHGFTNPTTKDIKKVTIAKLNTDIEKLVASGVASRDDGTYALDLGKLGVKKLLGTGIPAYAFNITVEMASAGAVKKIESAGGSVALADAGDAGSEKDAE